MCCVIFNRHSNKLLHILKVFIYSYNFVTKIYKGFDLTRNSWWTTFFAVIFVVSGRSITTALDADVDKLAVFDSICCQRCNGDCERNGKWKTASQNKIAIGINSGFYSFSSVKTAMDKLWYSERIFWWFLALWLSVERHCNYDVNNSSYIQGHFWHNVFTKAVHAKAFENIF